MDSAQRSGLQVIKREIREHQLYDGTKAPMWFYLVHYMVCCGLVYPVIALDYNVHGAPDATCTCRHNGASG